MMNWTGKYLKRRGKKCRERKLKFRKNANIFTKEMRRLKVKMTYFCFNFFKCIDWTCLQQHTFCLNAFKVVNSSKNLTKHLAYKKSYGNEVKGFRIRNTLSNVTHSQSVRDRRHHGKMSPPESHRTARLLKHGISSITISIS